MADQPIHPDPSDTPAATPPPPPRKKRKSLGRRIVTWLGVLVVLLVLLVLLAPTLASTGWARGVILGQVNKQLNGTVAVGDWNLGWTSNISASDIVVRDASGAEVVKLKSLQTELTTLEAARMNFDAGRVVIDGLWVDARRDANGELNLANLAKPSDPAATPPGQPADPNAKTTLPNVKATVVVQNSSGTFTDAALNQTVAFDLAGEVAIPDINQPIKNDLTINTKVGDGQRGTLSLAGEADIAENNELQVDLSKIKQTLKMSGIDASSLAVFVPPDAGVTTLTGIFDGELKVDGTADGAIAQGPITGRGVRFGGPVLNGDVLDQPQLRIDIPRTVVRLPREGETFDAARFTIGEGGDNAQPLTIQFAQGRITFRGDLPGVALTRLANNQAPGATGDAVLTADVDVGKLAEQLPNTMKINDDLSQLKGQLAHRTTLTLAPERATVATTTNLTDVSATRREGGPVTLKPVNLDLTATTLGAGGGGDIPDVRDLKLTLASGFANADITGRDLGSIAGQINGSLNDMQHELGQFVDFGTLKLGGRFSVRPSVKGDLVNPEGSALANVQVEVQDLLVDGIEGQPPLKEERVMMTANGTVIRGRQDEKFVVAVNKPDLSLQVGQRQTPTVDLGVTATAVDLSADEPALNNWEIGRLIVDLNRLQKELPQLAQAIAGGGVQLTSGRVNVTGRGSYDAQKLTINQFVAAVQELTMTTPDGRQVGEPRSNLTFDMTGEVRLADDATRITVDKLNLVEQKGYLSVKKASGGKLAIVLPKTGGFAATEPGELQVGASLGYLNSILRAMQKPEVAAQTSAGQIQKGFLAGTIKFDPQQGGSATTVAANLNIKDLVVTTDKPRTPLSAGDVTLAFDATAANDLSTLTVPKLLLGSQFATANVTDVGLNLAAASPFEMVRSASVRLDVPDAGKAWAVKEAFAPTAPAPATDGEEPLPPLQITGGQLNVAADVKSDNGAIAMALRNLSGQGVRLVRGPADQTLDDFKLTADARVTPTPDGGLSQLAVSKLTGNFGFADVNLTQPLQVSGLGEGQTLAVNGTINGSSDLQRTMTVLNVLSASTEPPAYAGTLNFTQKFNTANNAVTAAGDARVTGFRTLGQGGNGEGAQQINDEIRLTNDVRLNLADESLAINNVRLLMPNTKAIDLQAKGTITQFNTARNLDLGMTLATDWEKLWQVVYPMLAPETRESLADAKLFGIDERNWTVKGSYPAGLPSREYPDGIPSHEAIKKIQASGGIGIKQFQGMGLDVRELDAPFAMADGRVEFLPARQAVKGQYTPNAQVNGGVMNLMKVVLDLSQPDGVRINTPKDYKLLVRASMNPVLADKIFGKFVNPVLADAKQARGQVDVIVEHCENFSPAQLSTATTESAAGSDAPAPERSPRRRQNEDEFDRWRREQSGGGGGEPDARAQAALATVDNDPGRLQVRFSVTQMQLGSPTLEALTGLNIANVDIRDSRVSVARGVVKSDIGMTINDQGTMRFNGAVNMANSTILNMVVAYPKELLPTALREAIGDKGLSALPATFQMPMSGRLDAPQFDLAGAVQKNLLSTDTIGNVLGDVLGGRKDDDKKAPPPPQRNPQRPPPPDRQRQPAGDEPIGQQPIGQPQDRQQSPQSPRDGARPREERREDPLGDLIRGLTDDEKEKERERRERDRQR